MCLDPGPKPLWKHVAVEAAEAAKHKPMRMKSLGLSARSYKFRPHLAKSNQESRTRAPHGQNILSEKALSEFGGELQCLIGRPVKKVMR